MLQLKALMFSVKYYLSSLQVYLLYREQASILEEDSYNLYNEILA